jgi:hypothetical protein
VKERREKKLGIERERRGEKRKRREKVTLS